MSRFRFYYRDRGAELAAAPEPSVGYVAFFGDVSHGVTPVKSGHCVTLTYEIYLGDIEPVPVYGPASGDLIPRAHERDFHENFEALLENGDLEFLPDGGTLGFGVRHIYPIEDHVEYVHPRRPYAGELVFTAFSGSHQDAIKKGFEDQAKRHALARSRGEGETWEMPYLPVDPADLGQTYEAVIRVNSQSGKGGIAYLVKQYLHLDLPRARCRSLSTRSSKSFSVGFNARSGQSDVASAILTSLGLELPRCLQATFFEALRAAYSPSGRLSLKSFELDYAEGGTRLTGEFNLDDKVQTVNGIGNGPLSALLACLHKSIDGLLVIREYSEHALGQGTEVGAVSYVELVYEVRENGQARKSSGWGVVSHTDIAASGLHAVMSAVNRVGAVWKTPA